MFEANRLPERAAQLLTSCVVFVGCVWVVLEPLKFTCMGTLVDESGLMLTNEWETPRLRAPARAHSSSTLQTLPLLVEDPSLPPFAPLLTPVAADGATATRSAAPQQ